MHPTYRGLAFLLSFGTLPIACNKDDNETDSTGTTGTTTDPTTPTTTSASGSTTSGASETTDDGTTTGTTTGTSTGDTDPAVTTFLTSNTDTDTADTFDTDDTGDLPAPTDPTCIAYGAHYAECFPRESRYAVYIAQYCELYKGYALRQDGQGCVDAMEMFFVCMSKVDCAEFPNDPCQTELNAASVACPNLFEDDGSSTTGFESESSTEGDMNSTG